MIIAKFRSVTTRCGAQRINQLCASNSLNKSKENTFRTRIHIQYPYNLHPYKIVIAAMNRSISSRTTARTHPLHRTVLTTTTTTTTTATNKRTSTQTGEWEKKIRKSELRDPGGFARIHHSGIKSSPALLAQLQPAAAEAASLHFLFSLLIFSLSLSRAPHFESIELTAIALYTYKLSEGVNLPTLRRTLLPRINWVVNRLGIRAYNTIYPRSLSLSLSRFYCK